MTFRTNLSIPAALAVVLSCASCTQDRSLMEICARMSACRLPEPNQTAGASCSLVHILGMAARRKGDMRDLLFAAQLDCLKRASDCEALGACLVATPAEAAMCVPGPDGSIRARCNGDRLVVCGDPSFGDRPPMFDCGAAGLICREDDAGGWCGLAVCDPAATPSRCDGRLLVQCVDGLLTQTDCAKVWTRNCTNDPCEYVAMDSCAVGDGGQPACVATGETCYPATFERHCDGTRLVSCVENKVTRFECGFLLPWEGCGETDGGVDCVPRLEQCQEYGETCFEGRVTSCTSLGEISFDCTKYGYSGCTSSQEGSFPIAYCR